MTKSGEGCLLEYSIHSVHMPLTLFSCAGLTITMTALAFWRNGSLDKQEINGSCVDPKLRWQKTTLRKFVFPVWATKTLVVTTKQGYNILCVFSSTIDGSAQKTLNKGRLRKDNLCKNLGVNQEGGHLFKGGIFLVTYKYIFT